MNDNLLLIGFILQLLFGELIFLYPAEKRFFFPLRYAASWAALLLLACFFPVRDFNNVWFQLFLFLLMFALSVVAMWFCFEVRFSAVLASCVAGYAVQHITFHICSLFNHTPLLAGASLGWLGEGQLRELLIFPPCYLVFFFTLGRYSEKNECYKKYDSRFDIISFATIFICIGLTRFARFFGDMDSMTVDLYAIAACFMALMVQLVLFRTVSLQHENETLNLLWQEERKQYEISKKTIDTINIKYHDLKHKLRGMNLPKEEIDSIKDAVRVYQSRFQTGNEALDVLLTENSLRCGEEGITLTYMGNGADLSFMNTMDVYSLFGNAVDNAVEAVRCLPDKDRRFIDIVSERRGNFLTINIVNCFDGSLSLQDGLPATTKHTEEGFHGFGIKSMKLVAEKYGGNLNVTTESGLFNLNIYLLHS